MSEGLSPTGWCHACGQECTDLFCNPRCERRHQREQAALTNRMVRRGKRAGYGVGGSTH